MGREWLIFAMPTQTVISWPFLANAKQTEGLTYLTAFGGAAFEEEYFSLREKEGRILDLQALQKLPKVDAKHPHAQEWKVREDSLHRFLTLLRSWHCDRILDLGCGNGWMSRRVAEAVERKVLGMDLNQRELKDAQAAFGRIKELDFVYADIFEAAIPAQSFDLIYLAGSVQYFSDLSQLLQRLLHLLSPGGRIVIFDSHFYAAEEVGAAHLRSKEYYENLGFPAFAEHYFHHSRKELSAFKAHFLYDPQSIKNRVFRLAKVKAVSPFPMIMIQKQDD